MTEALTAAEGDTLARARRELWQAVCARDEYAAARAVFGALDSGAGTEDVLLDVIAAVQREVGRAWAENRFSVAQEHSATAIHDRIIAAMAHRIPEPSPTGAAGTVTVACVDGEWHALPARLLAEVLRGRGYRVDFLGAQVPTPHLIAHLHSTSPTAVALSSSIPLRLPAAHTAITAVQALAIPVVAGGSAFGFDGRYARLLGADAWAPDARAAAELLGRGLRRPARGAVRQSIEDLPHLADQEYTLVLRSRRQLVKNALAGLLERVPAMRAYTDAQHERTAEDVAHVVEFLGCALYTDDGDLFTGFLDWTGDILEARRVPSRVLDPCLVLLEEELKDFPRALGFLARGRETLRRRDARPPVPGPDSSA
ncbi:cobalamin B12-binding domain-containing protein [Streptomyces zinciresistens K42]|uniref:Cobalamin B12-binding domain-containing protein n=1 Tax=Streptomyces zinciresistens K42 TaxID=700597 RepID=G2GJ85_9ACTN|nr:cobalamin-dependent protein [Streptomyces zinciresistens]EGX56436.1 cobalamin B12-binding domain-containing protein [Streptomyces zinciresistens K42]